MNVLRDPKANASERVSAANALLDRGWGRPTQTINASTDHSEHQRAIDEALARFARDLLQRIRGSENTHKTDVEASTCYTNS